MFNVAGVLLWLGFIDQLAAFVTSLSPLHPELTGLDRLAQETPRQIANAHTVFNIANTLIFIGFTGVFARVVEFLVPDKPLPKDFVIKPKYLEETLIGTPALGLESARFEVVRVGYRSLKILEEIGPAFIAANTRQLKAIKKSGDEIDKLSDHIITYLRKLGRGVLTESDDRQLNALVSATTNLQTIANLIDSELVPMGLVSVHKKLLMSDATRVILEELQQSIQKSLSLCVTGLEELKEDTAEIVFSRRVAIKKLSAKANHHLLERLQADEPDRLDLYGLEISVVEQLRRIHYSVKQLARNVTTLVTESDNGDDEQSAGAKA